MGKLKKDEKTAVQNKKSKTPKKKENKVTRNFPQYPLEKALEIAKAIAKHNAGNPWGSEQIADAIGISSKSTNFYYITTTSRDYGLTTGTSKSKNIELTSLGRKITYPESKQGELDAIKQAFNNIDDFKKVSEYYNNSTLPEEKYLFNTLKETFDIDESLHKEFYKIYLENIAFIGKYSKELGVTNGDQFSKTMLLDVPAKASQYKLFVIMPFSEKTDRYSKGYFDEVFSSMIVPAAAEAGYNAVTAQRNGSDIIHSTIVSDIYNSEIILADLTEHNPNVLFELGLAIAFKKKVALIRAKGTTPIFDVDNLMRVFDYDSNLWKSTIERDIPKLSKHITATAQTSESLYLDILLKKAN